MSDQYGRVSYASLSGNPSRLPRVSCTSRVTITDHYRSGGSVMFTRGATSRLYYSAGVRRDRPLDRILLAYHAFANVLLMYRDVLRGGLDVERYERLTP